MPRPTAPPPIFPIPKPEPFQLERASKAAIADALGIAALGDERVSMIEALISCYIPTRGGANDTTPKNVVAAIEDATRQVKKLHKALQPFLRWNSGLDDETLVALYESANRVNEAIGNFGLNAQAQKKRLQICKRVMTNREPKRYFCSILSHFFSQYSSVITSRDTFHQQRRKFALEILRASGDDISQYIEHPNRLYELLDSALVSGVQHP